MKKWWQRWWGLVRWADRDGRQVAARGGCGVVHPGMQGIAFPAPVSLAAREACALAQAHDLRPAQPMGADPPGYNKQAALRDGRVVGHDLLMDMPGLSAATQGLIERGCHLSVSVHHQEAA